MLIFLPTLPYSGLVYGLARTPTYREPVSDIVQLLDSRSILAYFSYPQLSRTPVSGLVCSTPPVLVVNQSVALYPLPPPVFNSKLICDFVFLPPPVPQCISSWLYYTHTSTYHFRWISIRACIHILLVTSSLPYSPFFVD